MSVRVAIDARWIFPQLSGIGAYTQALLRAWAQCPDLPVELTVLFADAAIQKRTAAICGFDRAPAIRCRHVPCGPLSPRSQIVLPRLLALERIHLFHSPNYMVPLLARVPLLATIHDLIPLRFPHYTPRAAKVRLLPLYRGLMRAVAHRCCALITDSEASRRDIQALLVPPRGAGSVHVVPCGVDDRFFAAPARSRPARTAPFRLLYVGRADPYKNLTGVVECLRLLRESHGLDAHLQIVGSPDPRYPEPQRRAAAAGLADRLHWTPRLSDAELLGAYREADCLVHLSLYEGFGLPVLEAMAAGLPVVCSDRGALPEVAGDAAVMVDPDDLPLAAVAVRDLLLDPARRDALAARGRERAARFTWADAAAATLRIYLQYATRAGEP